MTMPPSTRSAGADLVYSFWLVFSRHGGVNIYRKAPSVSADERAMRVEARLPKALWNIPALSAEIAVPDPGQPSAINARIEQFADQLRTAIGCDVVLTVKPPEDTP